MDNVRLACAAVRILAHRLWNRISGHQPEPPKPVVHVVALGLTGSGKSTSLCMLAGEPLDEIEPTTGFHIKDIQLSNSFCTVKELGGNDKVRKYWHHYYANQQGVIFYIDGTSSTEYLETARCALFEAMKHKELRGLPLLVIVSHQDHENCLSPEEITARWNLPEEFGNNVLVQGFTTKDVSQLRETFNAFASRILGLATPDDIPLEGRI